MHIRLFVLLLMLSATSLSPSLAQVPASPQPILAFDTPFLFAYGTWDKKARIENGAAILDAAGLTPKGGAGVNLTTQLDLRAHADDSPGLRLRVGPRNTLKTLKLLLIDTAGHAGTWEFSLPAPGANPIVVTPTDGAAFAEPNSAEKGAPDLAKIMQWQMTGDWGGDGPVDVRVESILAVPPDAAIKTSRQASVQRAEDARQATLRDQADQRARYGKRGPLSPRVVGVAPVAPDVLSLTIEAGRVIPGSLSRYIPQPGDEKDEKKGANGAVQQVILKRGGQEVGWLIGPQRDTLVAYEKLEGDPLLAFLADAPETYTVSSTDDPAFAQAVRPIAVYRKSKPTDWVQPGRGFAMRHIVYLRLPHVLTSGRHYTVGVAGLNVTPAPVVFADTPSTVRSEAVHASQIGYRPDDPVKRAFLSVWLGTGGSQSYPPGLRFDLLDDRTGHSVFSGRVEVARRADEKELMFRDENFNKTDVSRMDFSAFHTPGHYRVSVRGIGCSYPFEIGRDVWTRAFQIQMKGLYNERSGVALGPPSTPFVKPRDFHPGDPGVSVTQSTYSILDGGDGQKKLAQGDTGKVVPEAWGGYHDAGDWNPRRVTHLRVTMAQLEILDMFPRFFGALPLHIPPTPKVPDVLAEALFEIDCFRRLQQPDGGVRHGIETAGDPVDGEVSWLQSMPAYVYAADPWGSSVYAAAAGRAAKLLSAWDPARAKVYRDSAVRAMTWAEAERDRLRAAGKYPDGRADVRGDRALAAVTLYDLTGDPRWRLVFQESAAFGDEAGIKSIAPGDRLQYDAAFVCARLKNRPLDPVWRANAVRLITQAADKALAYAAGNAWNLTTPDKGQPLFMTFYSEADARELARAHFLTGAPKYLAGVVQATQFQSGANPANMTYTTGLGANPIRHPLHLDSRRTGQPAPAGLTVYGNFDFVGWTDWSKWVIDYYLGAATTPTATAWPIPEAYFDIFLYPSTNEFTVDAWDKNVFVWGYLAARK